MAKIAPVPPARLQIRLLGDFRVTYGETPVTEIKTTRLQSLLCYLMLHQDAPQMRRHLAFVLWPDSVEAQSRTNLRNLLHLLRAALPHADQFLQIDGQTVQWNVQSPHWLDVAEFQHALARADLAQAVEFYRGDLLPSCYDDWILPERERLREAYLRALDELRAQNQARGDQVATLAYAQRLLHADPLREETYRHVIRLHLSNGDRAAALHTYHNCATTLARELAVEPAPVTRELYEQIVHLQAAPISLAPTTALIGRQVEWEQIQMAWRGAQTCSQVVIIRGEAGIGKTRLVEEFVAWTKRQNVQTASAYCYAAEGRLAYTPLSAWLRESDWRELADAWLIELARLVPEIATSRPDLPAPEPLTEAWQNQRFFEALARGIADERKPRVLVLDDAQWCDSETLEWLHWFARQATRGTWLLLVTLRVGENLPHALGNWLSDLRRNNRLTEIELRALTEAETLTLAEQLSDKARASQFAASLWRGSEGNPLFIVEMVRSGEWSTDNAPLPPQVRAIIQTRLAQLSPTARELIGLAAVCGREFNFAALERASGYEQSQLVRALDELWQRRLIREQGADAYDFAHDRIRETAEGELSAARRRLWHHRIADGLRDVHAANLNAVAGQIAAHYERAGETEATLANYLRAAQYAQTIYANADALSLLQHGLELIPALTQVASAKFAVQFYELRGDVLHHIAKPADAETSFANALAYVSADESLTQARLIRKRGNTYGGQDRKHNQLSFYETASRILRDARAESDAAWWHEWLDLCIDRMGFFYSSVQPEEITKISDEALPQIQTHGTPRQQSAFYECLVQRNLRRDRYVIRDETLEFSRQAMRAAEKTSSRSQRLNPQFGLAFGLLWRGEVEEAEREMETVARGFAEIGETNSQMLALTYLTILARRKGEIEQVDRLAAECLTMTTALKAQTYIGVARANQAWVAWRRQESNKAEAHARAGLALFAPTYPFRWLALMPLIDLLFQKNELDEAIVHARALLDPIQLRLPDELNESFERAIDALNRKEIARCRDALGQALKIAQARAFV
ncbi:Transcriptional regulatory protein MoaR1 [Anaerolineae bacterium]|nr:Transcriptional regulatory protein MoaR1 [Anaerolineae bacterium]